jgi:hypothetical protein
MKIFVMLCTILLPFVTYADFKLSDFEGNYTTYSSSAGGITVPDSNNASVTVISQLTIDKNGNGKINFLSSSLYSTPDVLTSNQLTNLPLKFTLTDPCHGIGKLLVFGNPETGEVTEFDVIATKSHQRLGRNRGRVTDMLFNIVKITNLENGDSVVSKNTRLVIVKRQ